MSDDRITPEEFARLIALPEAHPERVAAERTPQFASLRRLFADFERMRATTPPDADAESARAELARRFAERTAAPGGTPRVESRRAAGGGSLFDVLFAPLRTPAGRVAFAAVAVAVIAATGWWTATRPARTSMMRGAETSGFHLLSPVEGSGRLTLSWTPAADADGYEVVFLGADLVERARLPVGPATSLELSGRELPAGLVSGSDFSVEIVALRSGDPIAVTPTREVRLP